MPFEARHPRIGRDVGDRIFLGKVLVSCQARIKHAVQAVFFFGVAVDCVRHRFLGRAQEMVHLSEHRPDAAHLEHQPLQRVVFQAVGFRQQLAGLARQINEYRARLHHRVRLAVGAVGIDQRRNLAVGTDGDELGCELVVLADIDRVGTIRQPGFFEHDGNLAPVGRGPGIKIEHGRPLV